MSVYVNLVYGFWAFVGFVLAADAAYEVPHLSGTRQALMIGSILVCLLIAARYIYLSLTL
jgi:hypothetical protein